MKYRDIESINWEKEFPEVPENVHNAISSATHTILAKNHNINTRKCNEKQEKMVARERKETIVDGMGDANRRSKKKITHFPRKRMLLLVAIITLMSGMTVAAATSLWKDRMEAMNQQQIEEYFLSITVSNAPAFRYNRGMTDTEQAQMEQITIAYEEEGRFPQGALKMLNTVDDYKGKGVGYEPVSGTFFLPDEELTEEQLLQIVDFYHKLDYSLATVNAKVESGEIEEISPTETEAEPPVELKKEVVLEQDFESINENISCAKIALQGEDRISKTVASDEYLYLGFKEQVKRVPLNGGDPETVYELNNGEALFSLGCDDAENLYISVCDYREEDGFAINENNRIIKVDATGQKVLEYDMQPAVDKKGNTLQDNKAYKMLTDVEGNLYVKPMWCEGLQIYVFDVDGKFAGMIDDTSYDCNPAHDICLGEDGYLYALTWDYLVKIDTTALAVVENYDYVCEEMAPAVSMLYPMDEDSFYLGSYDGIFQYNLGETGSTRVLAPHETDAIAESCRWAPISQDIFAVTNYKDWGLEVTYYSIKTN